MSAVIDFVKRFSTEQKFIFAFCVLVIVCTLYRDCLLCKYVPKLDGFNFNRKEEGFSTDEDSKDESKEDAKEKEGFMDVEEKEDFENMEKASMVLFYAPWCPHCKSVMGDWAKLKDAAPKHVNIAKVNCDQKPHMAEKHKVKGFPTIILFRNGKKTYFEGPRDLDHFLKFLQQAK